MSLAALVGSGVACGGDIGSGIDSANDLMYKKQYVEAERLYRKLLKRLGGEKAELSDEDDSQRLVILDRLGKVNALYLHNFTQAIADFRVLVQLYPDTDQAFGAHATMADIFHHKIGDLQAAIDEYQKMVLKFPDEAETRRAQLQIALAYFQMKNYEQARTEAESLIHRWPKSSEASQARFEIANAYYVQARYTEAIATYEKMIETVSDKQQTALVLFELGNCFLELDESQRALAYYYACLTDHPDPLLVQRKITRVRNRLNKARPGGGIILPDYLRDKLLASGQPLGELHVSVAQAGGQARNGPTPRSRVPAAVEDDGPSAPTSAPSPSDVVAPPDEPPAPSTP